MELVMSEKLQKHLEKKKVTVLTVDKVDVKHC